ncbi:MAG TPA: thiamine pyrophosphate-dependent enzyme [Verrucomicrobiota bacterium]|nr:thiamine pyrophosphate-binding protein [Verrucomicrobiales bacterium]HRI11628.1 thiamine pyrophosphate-dependent enzyme [Verrucomicrobiota bacterium]
MNAPVAEAPALRINTRPITDDVLNVADFNDRIVGAYNDGTAELDLPADPSVARSLITAGSGSLRDFSYIAPEIPLLNSENCVACMACVIECPDTAILGKVVPKAKLDSELEQISDPIEREHYRKQFGKTTKFWNVYEKKGQEPGYFGIFIDPTKCKGCAECVEACGDHGALTMLRKEHNTLPKFQKTFDFYRKLPETPKQFINDKLLTDMMLADRSLLYVGGAGSCMGCGEATAIRMMLAATGFVYGKESVGIINSTGCSTVYASTYPYNPYLVPWSNSLFENGPTYAMGVRSRWDQMGWKDRKLWVFGGDGAMLDIGFQALSRMLMSGMNIKVLILDTQVYSNTGGQSSTGSYMGQNTKFSVHGKAIPGKMERRKEIAQIAMMHPEVLVAQTSCAMTNHFYKSIIAANEYDGPAVVSVYTTCQPEHGVGDNMAMQQSKLAVDTRTFPVLLYDPRKGSKISERLSLQGNPASTEDFFIEPKTNEVYDFVMFARSEGRFAKQFDAEGNPSETILASRQERLDNWRVLQELAGLR